ncbi:hydrogenase maturation nickel metallochaperone HypA/HybF [Metabacillus halosaccharovorans]|uniref:hydrogenase maturation nickel metallochaperone HypA/HybF n=1 Tax=Metabacillus halosaccharovorans TaxID=930124 RepID=UPI003736B4CD
MHELALMSDILTLIEEDALQHGIEKIEEIELIVGDLSNVMHDALYMAFDIHKVQGHPLLTDQTLLIVEREKAKSTCGSCNTIYEPDNKFSFCPSCKQPNGEIISGETFIVKSYEGS